MPYVNTRGLATTSTGWFGCVFFSRDPHDRSLNWTLPNSPNMFVARQRAAFVARQLQRTARTYASDAHAHHKAPEVNESFSVRRVKNPLHHRYRVAQQGWWTRPNYKTGLTMASRLDLSSPSAVSSAPSSSTSSFLPRASNLQSSTSSTSTLRAARTGRTSMLFTPRPWSRLDTTETFSRTAATSTDLSMLLTPSSFSRLPISYRYRQ